MKKILRLRTITKGTHKLKGPDFQNFIGYNPVNELFISEGIFRVWYDGFYYDSESDIYESALLPKSFEDFHGTDAVKNFLTSISDSGAEIILDPIPEHMRARYTEILMSFGLDGCLEIDTDLSERLFKVTFNAREDAEKAVRLKREEFYATELNARKTAELNHNVFLGEKVEADLLDENSPE